MTSYTTSTEYEPWPFYTAWSEGSTILDFLSYTAFWRCWSDKFPKLMIKSKALVVCDSCYIFSHYYKSLKKESYEKPDDLIYDYDDYDDYYDDAVDGDRNDPDVITYVELGVQNSQHTKSKRHVLSSHLQRIQADDLKERYKNQTI